MRQEVQHVSHQKEEAQSKLASLQKELDTLNERRKEIKVSRSALSKIITHNKTLLIIFASYCAFRYTVHLMYFLSPEIV